jgi:hypothetical protein
MAMARQFFEQSSRFGVPGPSMGMGEVARQLDLMAATREAVPDFSGAWSGLQQQEDPRVGMPPMAWAGEFDASHSFDASHGATLPAALVSQLPGGAIFTCFDDRAGS